MKPLVACWNTSSRLFRLVASAGGMLLSLTGAFGFPGTISTTLSPSGNIVTGTVVTVTLRISNYTESTQVDGFAFVVEFDDNLYEYIHNPIVLNDQPGVDENWLRKPPQDEVSFEPILRNDTRISSRYVFVGVADARSTMAGTEADSGFLLSFQLRAINEGQAEFRLHSPRLLDYRGLPLSITPEVMGASNSIVSATAPIIIQPPMNQTAAVGSSVGFSVTATGTMPFSYQWRRNGQPLTNSGRVFGATTRQLSIVNLQPTDAGSYSVLVSNIAGAVLSPSALLTVLQPPVIQSQPASISVVTGVTARFMVTASGSVPLAYQWGKNGVAVTNGGRVSGANTPMLTIANVQPSDAAAYRVTVTNAAGTNLSAAALLTVGVPPFISSQPSSANVLTGQLATFTVAATGSPVPGLQWRKNGLGLTNGGRISGVNTPTLAIANVEPGDAGPYSVVATNFAGTNISAEATLAVIVPPSFSTQPVSTAVLTGQVASFTVTAQGSPLPALRWQREGVPLIDDGRISGALTPALTLANVQLADAGGFACVATNSGGRATSIVARLEVCTPPIILTNPVSQVSPLLAAVGFSVQVGGTPDPTVQWFRNDEPIPGATNALLLLSNAHRATVGLYRAVAANACGRATSSVAELQVCVTLIGPILRGIMATDAFDDGGGGGAGGAGGGAPLLWQPASAISTLPFHGVPLLYTTYRATGVVSCGAITGYHCKYVWYTHVRSTQRIRATAHAGAFPTLLAVTERGGERKVLACASANEADGRSSTVQFLAESPKSYNVWAGGVGTNTGEIRVQIGDAFQNLQRTAEGFFTFEVAGDVSAKEVGFTYTLSSTGLVETAMPTWAHAVTIRPQTNDWVCAFTNPVPLMDLERYYGLRGEASSSPVLGLLPSGACLTNRIPTLPKCGCHGLFLPP